MPEEMKDLPDPTIDSGGVTWFYWVSTVLFLALVAGLMIYAAT